MSKYSASIVMVILLAVATVFAMAGCENHHNTNSNVYTLYEFADNYEPGVPITKDMLREIRVDIGDPFITSAGETWDSHSLREETVITPENIERLILDRNAATPWWVETTINAEGQEVTNLRGGVAKGQLLIWSRTASPYNGPQADANNTECIRLKTDVSKGAQITAANLEIVSVPAYCLPVGVYRSAAEVVGKYAVSQLYAGDYLIPSKLSNIDPSGTEEISPSEGKTAVSVQISRFAGSLSGKLERGDIVSFWFRNENGEPYVPEALQYVMVISVGDIDKDQIIVNDDGSFPSPATVTVAVSEAQAKLLIELHDALPYLTLVYRGNDEESQKYLDMQDEILAKIQEEI